ncbi:hypothetical protein evm_010882 [Chilo suppressalis]|nr:hypothetical protein evm_010882 [Chilo suppressalis]
MKVVLFCFLNIIALRSLVKCSSNKKPVPYTTYRPHQKYGNPDFVKDRFEKIIVKPEMPETWINRFKRPFSPSWMDYCDPYHCDDYHKIACGLNRRTMRFKWFQSECHIILNNQCAAYRGALKFDKVDTKYCTAYVMFLRGRLCPADCEDASTNPVCAISVTTKQLVKFKNKCAMQKANCKLESLYGEFEVLDRASG